MKKNDLLFPRRGRRITRLVALLVTSVAAGSSAAEDWGAYSLVPVSAQALVLEAVGSGTNEGTVVSIGKPAGTANQKWVIAAKGTNSYSIRPASCASLVLAAAKGGAGNGTAIVLEPDQGQPWQAWSIKKHENGTYGLSPMHAPDKGLDDFGGKQSPGARQDLWTYKPGDPHLQWMIKPLAGTAVPAADTAPAAYQAPSINPKDILEGVTKKGSFTNSALFPGKGFAICYDASKRRVIDDAGSGGVR